MKPLITTSACLILLTAPVVAQGNLYSMTPQQRIEDFMRRNGKQDVDPNLPYTPRPGWPCGVGERAAIDKKAYWDCVHREQSGQNSYVTPQEQYYGSVGKPVPKPDSRPAPSKRGQSVEF